MVILKRVIMNLSDGRFPSTHPSIRRRHILLHLLQTLPFGLTMTSPHQKEEREADEEEQEEE